MKKKNKKKICKKTQITEISLILRKRVDNNSYAWQRCDITRDDGIWRDNIRSSIKTALFERKDDEWTYTYRTFADACLSADYSCRMTLELHALAPFCAFVTRNSIDGWPHLRHLWIDPRFCHTATTTHTRHEVAQPTAYWPRSRCAHRASVAAMLSQTSSPTNNKFARARHLARTRGFTDHFPITNENMRFLEIFPKRHSCS